MDLLLDLRLAASPRPANSWFTGLRKIWLRPNVAKVRARTATIVGTMRAEKFQASA